MLKIPLALSALIRDWRGGELTLLSLTLIVALASVTALNNFANIVNYQLNQQAANMFGADVVLTTSQPLNDSGSHKASTLGLTQTQTLSFLTMVEHKDKLQLAEIKAISTPYPLLGQLKIASQLYGLAQTINQAPKEGHVWVGRRLFPALLINIGDDISIGAAHFVVDGVLMEEPGQTGNWFNIAPRIFMNQKDVSKTAVVLPGSKVTYSWLLAGKEQNLTQLKKELAPGLNEQQQWSDSKTSNPAINKTIERSLIYLQVGSLMSLVLAGVAISMASRRYCQRHQQHVAIYRCFGASQREILTIFLGCVFILGNIACLVGILLGFSLQPLFLHWLGGLLVRFDAPFSLKPALLSYATGMLLLLSFTLVNLLKVRKVTAISIFRQQQPTWQLETYISYGLAFAFLGSFAYFYTKSAYITMMVLSGCVFFIALVMSTLYWGCRLFAASTRIIHLNWRFGFANIARNVTNSALQVIGIGLALSTILSLTLIRNNLINEWQQQLPIDAANFFVINIEPSQVNEIKAYLHTKNIKSSELYPIVRGRLVSINSLPVKQVLGDKIKEINALQRELNFSWVDKLPEDNHIVAGQWGGDKAQNWISIEEGLAKRLNVKTGDLLGFRIGANLINATITSVRTVSWTNFKPNFFILFKPGLLDNLPQSDITSIYVPPLEQSKLFNLVKKFPNVTVIDIVNMLKKFQTIFNSAGNAITLITLFGLLIGLIIATLAMLALSELKQQETQVLKVLGMQRRALLWIRSSESCFIGFYAGLLAIMTACFFNYYLNTSVLGLSFHIPWLLVMTVPLITAMVTIIINNLIMVFQYQRRKMR